MNTSAKKRELIKWIKGLDDKAVVEKMYNVKNNYTDSDNFKRTFGCGRELFGTVSTDFNEPLDMFKSYTK
jgi:hypothetical protein